jgi:hypothetical protein
MAVPTYQVVLFSTDLGAEYDITAYVLSVSISRGRSRELERFNAGTVSVTLNNRNRYFDPLVTTSPFYSLMIPRIPIEIRSATKTIFKGYVQDWNYSYDVSGESTANVTGADFFIYLAQMSLNGGVQTSELSGTRLNKLFVYPKDTGLTYPPIYPPYSLDSGYRTLQADTIAAGTNALEYAQLIEKTEGGYFFVQASGTMKFAQSRGTYNNNISFTDSGTSNATNFPYQSIEIVYGSELLYNDVTLTRVGGATANVIKEDSISRYGRIVYSDDNYLHNSNSDTAKQAYLLAVKYAEPEYRFESVSVMLNPLTLSQQQTVLGLEIATIVNVTFKPNQTGSSISKTVRIIGIDHQMNPDSHIVTFKFESVLYEPIILNNTVWGTLDYNVLGF